MSRNANGEYTIGPDLFTPAFATVCSLKVRGFMGPQMAVRGRAAVGLMALLCGDDYIRCLDGPVVRTYPPELMRKLRLLGGPHGVVWAALRLREEGYRLDPDSGVWVKQ